MIYTWLADISKLTEEKCSECGSLDFMGENEILLRLEWRRNF